MLAHAAGDEAAGCCQGSCCKAAGGLAGPAAARQVRIECCLTMRSLQVAEQPQAPLLVLKRHDPLWMTSYMLVQHCSKENSVKGGVVMICLLCVPPVWCVCVLVQVPAAAQCSHQSAGSLERQTAPHAVQQATRSHHHAPGGFPGLQSAPGNQAEPRLCCVLAVVLPVQEGQGSIPAPATRSSGAAGCRQRLAGEE